MTEIAIDSALANDPNYQAYSNDKDSGLFSRLPKEVWTLYINGVLTGVMDTQEEIFAIADNIDEEGERFISQPNMPEVIVDIPTCWPVDDNENIA